MLLAQGDVHAAAQWTITAVALTLLARLRDIAARQGRIGSIIEIGALRALALAACGNHASALSDLTDTLALAGPRGYVRVFADEGMPMRALLTDLQAAQPGQRHSARRIGPRYLAELVRACGGAEMARPRRPAATAAPGLVEPLTDREMEVLRLPSRPPDRRRGPVLPGS